MEYEVWGMRYEVCVFIPQVEQCLEYVHENISAVVASPAIWAALTIG